MDLYKLDQALESLQREIELPDKGQNLGGVIAASTAIGALVVNLALIGMVIRGPGKEYLDRTQKTRQTSNLPAPKFPVDRILESRKPSTSHMPSAPHYGRFYRGRR